MKIKFWGGTDEVTGSKTYLELPEGMIMIDCGMVQGPDEADRMNRAQLPILTSEIKAIIITHAHLDHSGYLPRLIKKGFTGPIYCTPASAKLIRIILEDSAGLLKDGDFYNIQDVLKTISMLKPIEWNHTVELLGSTFHFQSAGHILGASSAVIKVNNKKIVFSGDLGRVDDPLIPPPTPCPPADLVIMESTYGGKVRQGSYEKELHTFLTTISREGRVGIIASFAVARAQMLMTLIYEFYQRHPEEKVRVVLDSPMMKEASRVYKNYAFMTTRKDSLYEAMEEFEILEHQNEWETLKRKSGPLIILSSSGMLTGGRIQRHLANWQDDEKAILFLPGYQGEGTPGRAFLEGERRIRTEDDEMINWRGEVWSSEAFSSHADQTELMQWVQNVNPQSKIFLIHGEEKSKLDLKKKLTEKGFVDIEIPAQGAEFSF